MNKTKIKVCRISDIDTKGSRVLRVGDIEVALFRLSSGEVLAVENKCPHKGGMLSEGMVCGTKVHCPLHDWRIDLHSGTVQQPDHGCVTTFDVEIEQESEMIYVTI